MSILNEIEKDERIRQLEKENLLLKQRILSILSNEEMEKMQFCMKLATLSQQYSELRRHYDYLKLQVK